MMPVLQPEEEEASGSSAAPSPSVSTPSPSRSKVKRKAMLQPEGCPDRLLASLLKKKKKRRRKTNKTAQGQNRKRKYPLKIYLIFRRIIWDIGTSIGYPKGMFISSS